MDSAILRSLLQYNFLPVSICVFLIFFLIINRPYEKRVTECFYPIVILLFVLMVSENVSHRCTEVLDSSYFHRLIAIIDYSVRFFILAGISDTIIERINVDKVKYVYMPAIINALLLIPALWSDSIFYYNAETGRLIHGRFGFLLYATGIIYVLGLLFIAGMCMFYNKKSESILIAVSSLMCAGSVAIEIKYDLFGILIGVSALTLVFYYMYLHIEHFKYDPLTGALNKESFYADVTRFNNRNISSIMSIDVNNLKVVNDTQGHLEGDRLLKRTARTLVRNLKAGCQLYRVGGDEFVIICTKISAEMVEDLANMLTLELDKADASCAIGFALWTEFWSFEDVYRMADERMYTNKCRMKQERSR